MLRIRFANRTKLDALERQALVYIRETAVVREDMHPATQFTPKRMRVDQCGCTNARIPDMGDGAMTAKAVCFQELDPGAPGRRQSLTHQQNVFVVIVGNTPTRAIGMGAAAMIGKLLQTAKNPNRNRRGHPEKFAHFPPSLPFDVARLTEQSQGSHTHLPVATVACEIKHIFHWVTG